MHYDQKLWLILMCLLLLLILVAAALDGMEIIKIPDWAALLWVAVSLYTVYRNVYGLHMYDDSEADHIKEISKICEVYVNSFEELDISRLI